MARKAGLCSGDESPVVETLGGRVSNVVLPVRARRGAWVVKRALSQLPGEGGMACGQVENLHGERVSHADPRLDEGSSCAGGRLRRQRPLRLRPRVFGDGSRTWKQDLLSGLVDSAVARRAAAILTDFHSHTLGNANVRNRFRDGSNFYQLRLDPYLAATGRRHPDIKQEDSTAGPPAGAREVRIPCQGCI